MEFLSILAFLLVFIVIYALLVKSGVLGGSPAVPLFVSFLMASFFVIQASLVEFVQEISGWISVVVIVIFFLLVVIAFVPGAADKPLWFLSGKSWFGWIVLGIVIGVFVLVSSYVFNWVVNWDVAEAWVNSTWFGWVLLVVVALLVSLVIAKKAK